MFNFLSKQRKLLQTCKKFYNQEVSESLQHLKIEPEQRNFFWNISKGSFPTESKKILLAPLSKKKKKKLKNNSNLDEMDVEVKPDGNSNSKKS